MKVMPAASEGESKVKVQARAFFGTHFSDGIIDDAATTEEALEIAMHTEGFTDPWEIEFHSANDLSQTSSTATNRAATSQWPWFVRGG
jgi:hypothetical protein